MSSQKHDTAAKKRVLEILRILIEHPGHYTRRMLGELYNVSIDTIGRDFEEIQNAGFCLSLDDNYRYYLTAEKANEQIKELLLFSQQEKNLLNDLLHKYASEKDRNRIINKLETITNLPRIGNIVFTKPYLNKIAYLFKAKKDKQKVILHNYKSTNSNTHSNRKVEPFQINPDEDILHAFDLDRKEIRHFRISRIERVEQLDDDWENEGKHVVVATDIFKISSKDQVKIHIRLKTGGYNELTERYPLSKACLSPAVDAKDEYDLECMVNSNFYGLQNFLLGYHEYVIEIFESEELRKHMNNKVKKLIF